MSASQRRLAYAAFFAVVGGAAITAAVGRIANDNSPALLTAAWVASALVGCLIAWKVPDDEVLWRRPGREDLRFTRDGWSMLGWITVFRFPPLGFLIGLVLHARENPQGAPIVLVSLAAFAAYAAIALLV